MGPGFDSQSLHKSQVWAWIYNPIAAEVKIGGSLGLSASGRAYMGGVKAEHYSETLYHGDYTVFRVRERSGWCGAHDLLVDE